jgi:hypothetical protein
MVFGAHDPVTKQYKWSGVILVHMKITESAGGLKSIKYVQNSKSQANIEL